MCRGDVVVEDRSGGQSLWRPLNILHGKYLKGEEKQEE